MKVDSEGNIYLADERWGAIYKLDTTGTIKRVAGGGKTETLYGRGTDAQITAPAALAVDSRGNVYFPQRGRLQIVVRMSPDGNLQPVRIPSPESPQFDAVAMAVDADDNLYVAGPAGAEQTAIWKVPLDGAPSPLVRNTATEAIVLDREGNLYLGAVPGQYVRGVLPLRRFTVDGQLSDLALPVSRNAFHFGEGEIATVATIERASALTLDPDGNLLFADPIGDRVRRISDVAKCEGLLTPSFPFSGVVNGASFLQKRTSGLAPGEILSLFGENLGPTVAVRATPDQQGRFPTALRGVRVLFNGIPAPIIFVQWSQASVLVPFEVEGPVDLMVELDGRTSEFHQYNVIPASPAIFTINASGSGQGAILNQDGSINGPENPAARGSLVVLFATGAGKTNPPSVDGELAQAPLPRPLLDVVVTIDGKTAELLYAGAAPGLVAGVLQVNARVPEDLASRGAIPIVLTIGELNNSPQEVSVAIE